MNLYENIKDCCRFISNNLKIDHEKMIIPKLQGKSSGLHDLKTIKKSSQNFKFVILEFYNLLWTILPQGIRKKTFEKAHGLSFRDRS